MRQRYLPFVVGLITLASLCADQGFAVTLGELQAVPSVSPPYIFRLTIQNRPEKPIDSPAVTVRQPRTALTLVKNNILELYLPTLTDVELEVSDSGQTLNRLLLKSELQGARLRMEAATAWSRLVAAKADHLPQPQIVALLDNAYQTHHAWAQFDPIAAEKGMARVAQERRSLQTVPARQVHHSGEGPVAPQGQLFEMPSPVMEAPGAAAVTPTGAEAELEIQALREEMSELVARISPWGGTIEPAAGFSSSRAEGQLFIVFLAGGCLMGVMSILVGCWLQRRFSEQALQRRRIWRAIEWQGPKALTRGRLQRTSGQQHQSLSERHMGRPPTTRMRRLHVSLRMTRRLRLNPVHPHQEPILPISMRLPTSLPRHPRPETPTVSALLEALERLRSDLADLQRRPSSATPSTSVDFSAPRSERHRS